jgi:hypothetical protein
MSELLNEDDYVYKHKHNPTIYWLRWVFFIPISFVLFFFVADFPSWIGSTLVYSSYYLNRLLPEVLSCIIFMSTAKFIVPSHKKITGWVIVIVNAVIMIILLAIVIYDWYKSNNEPTVDYLTLIDSIVMAITTFLTNIFYKGESFLGLSSDF